MSSPDRTTTPHPQLASGPGRLIALVYVVFAVSAGVRAVYQLAVKFTDAPLSYSLSALAAAVYIIAAVAIVRGRRTLAQIAVGIELVGVIAVGAVSYLVPDWFPEASVWSHFGSGYGFVPLILPIGGQIYLWHFRRKQVS
ncbi:hypothetical protein [Haloglycomyces albus]|uniref:hypothetical protein n=1 Tax=Haloglycomyces albus TaxID=526067 RepID=UPI00046D7633|nr:hypothetical protein [Haloglycomyces albus]